MPELNKISKLLLICLSTFLIITCKKTTIDQPAQEINQQNQQQSIDLGAKVTASVSGFITNERDSAVQGATVQYGELTVTSDSYGYFEIKNATVNKNAAFVTVTNAGYFRGIKTFIIEEGQANFCRIKLIPKTIAGSVSSATGGVIATSSGLSIAIPSNGIMNASTKEIYTGNVHATMFWIDPTGNDLDKIMPGDLRGVDTVNAINLLATYGMAAVELTGDGGEQLQVAEGKKVNISFPLPASISADAPSTIPLWYFDETNGLWKEEGFASKSGNNYTGEVAHFSYWNCDIPVPSKVNFSCTIEDVNGNPIPAAQIYIAITSNSFSAFAHGYTNTNGFASGLIPANASLTLKVAGPGGCIEYTRNFNSSGVDVAFGSIRLPGNSYITVSGRAIDCNTNPITNGHIIWQLGNNYNICPVTANGSFSFALPIGGCNSNNFLLTAVNAATQEQSNAQTYTQNNQDMVLPDIAACGQSTALYTYVSIDGNSYMLGPNLNGGVICTAGHINYYPWAQMTNFKSTLLRLENGIYISHNEEIGLYILNSHWPPDLDSLNYVNWMDLNLEGSVTRLRPLASDPYQLNFTEYGITTGQFISGTFSGRLYPQLNVNGLLDTLNPRTVIYNFRTYVL